MPSWEQILQAWDTIGGCWLTLMLVLFHMFDEQRYRREIHRKLRLDREEE